MINGNAPPTKEGQLNITSQSANIKSNDSGLRHTCPYCQISNGSKMSKFIISGNRSFYIHNNCCREISEADSGCRGTAAVIKWLEEHTEFNFNKERSK